MSEQLHCDRCGSVVERVMGMDDMPGDNVLNIKLSGGYSQFIDNDLDSEPEPHTHIQLCHKCGHDFMTGFMNIPASEYSYWHPTDGSDYCEGWSV